MQGARVWPHVGELDSTRCNYEFNDTAKNPAATAKTQWGQINKQTYKNYKK